MALASLLIIYQNASSQINTNSKILKIEEALANQGYNDIKVQEESGLLEIDISTDQYRFASDGISDALLLIAPYVSPSDSLILTIKKLNFRLVSIHLKAMTLIELLEGTITRDEFIKKIRISNQVNHRDFFRKSTFKNPSFGKIDLVLEPNVGFHLGDYEIPFRYRINILPTIQVHLWKGAYFAPKFNIPIVKHYFTDKYNYFKPEDISLHQFFPLPLNSIGRIGIGLFSGHRYGYDFEFGRFFFNGRLFLRTNISYNGNAYYLKPGVEGIYNQSYDHTIWELTDINYWNYYINLEYRYPKYDLSFNLGYGRYLYYQKAWNLTIYRIFKEYYLGINAYLDHDFKNYGFTIKIPLLPKKYYLNTKFTVKPSKFIKYSYLATRDYMQNFKPGINLEELIIEHNPVYLQNYIMRNLFKKGNKK